MAKQAADGTQLASVMCIPGHLSWWSALPATERSSMCMEGGDPSHFRWHSQGNSSHRSHWGLERMPLGRVLTLAAWFPPLTLLPSKRTDIRLPAPSLPSWGTPVSPAASVDRAEPEWTPPSWHPAPTPFPVPTSWGSFSIHTGLSFTSPCLKPQTKTPASVLLCSHLPPGQAQPGPWPSPLHTPKWLQNPHFLHSGPNLSPPSWCLPLYPHWAPLIRLHTSSSPELPLAVNGITQLLRPETQDSPSLPAKPLASTSKHTHHQNWKYLLYQKP